METARITGAAVAQLGRLHEGPFFDRKSIRIAPGKLTRTASAFANTDGGDLIIGIEDDGSWSGAPDMEALNGHLQALEALFPYGTECMYTFLQNTDDSTYGLLVTVSKAREIKEASDGKAYVRRGAQSLPVSDLAHLKMQKGITSLETATLNYAYQDLVVSPVAVDFAKSVVPTTEPEPWLRKQSLIVNDLPTVAGTLLFHEEPQIHLPKSSLKLYRYTTSDTEGSRDHLAYDPISIDGCIYDQVKAAVTETVRQVETIPTLDASGLKAIKYPDETVHEIITNALIHRDYSVNDDVHVRVFDNRVEVQSPGSLPANITASNILDERFSRNPVIVRLLNKFPDAPNKDVGEGLNTAFEAMRKLDLREPEIRDTGTSVIVVIWHETLASPESRIVDYLRKNKTINNSQARALLNRPEAERTIRRYFEALITAGEIERVPQSSGRGAKYRLVSAEPTD
ncbi:ATP-binding protein [Demequina sp.]|uniref:ATP-binding protein n=1 Tax=Demequina sp. TaxID=2050685 RepID=UPI003D11F8AC